MHVYCFPEGIELLKNIIETTTHGLSYEIVYHSLSVERVVVYEDEHLTVETFPLFHYMPAVGFLFKEKPRLRRLRGDMLEYYQVPVYKRAALKEGADFVKDDGTVVPNAALTLDPPASRSYAYCSDTMRDTRVADAVRGVTTLYHEATYGDDKAPLARERGHSTARQAGEMAQMAGAQRLVIGHYSQSYTDSAPLLEQAREVMPNTIAADEGLVIDL